MKLVSCCSACFLRFWDCLFRVVFLKQSLRSLQTASTNVPKSHGASAKGLGNMPLTQKVSFKTMLQKGNRVQLPKLIRWKFKLETSQILKVTVFPPKATQANASTRRWKKADEQPPAITRKLVETAKHDNQNITGEILESQLQSA